MRGWREDRGQSLIEFALVLPMLLVVCIGMAEIGRVTWAWNLAQQAASEGARHAIVVSDAAWADTAEAAAMRIISPDLTHTSGMLKAADINATLDDTTTPRTVLVEVDIPVTLILTFWEHKSYTVHGRARMDCQPSFYKPES